MVSCEWVVVTAADRAAATYQRLTPMPVYNLGPEGGGRGDWKAARRAPSTASRPQTRSPKPPLKGEVPALGGRRGSFPKPHRSRRLCQPP